MAESSWRADDQVTPSAYDQRHYYIHENRTCLVAEVLKQAMQKTMTEDATGNYTYIAHLSAWALFLIAGEAGPVTR